MAGGADGAATGGAEGPTTGGAEGPTTGGDGRGVDAVDARATDAAPTPDRTGELPRLLTTSLLERPAATVNAFEETVHRLLQSVQLGLVGPGKKLPPERELAGMLGVSRDTVREAIGALVAAGHLVTRRGRYGGTFVVGLGEDGRPGGADTADLSAGALEDTLAMRAVLEVGTARRLATVDLAAADRDLLWRTHETLLAADPADYRLHDTHLHLLLGQLVGAPELMPLLADLRMRLNAHLDRIPLLAPNLAHSDEQHERILSAVLTGRADAAAAAMAEHVDGTEKLLRGFLA